MPGGGHQTSRRETVIVISVVCVCPVQGSPQGSTSLGCGPELSQVFGLEEGRGGGDVAREHDSPEGALRKEMALLLPARWMVKSPEKS